MCFTTFSNRSRKNWTSCRFRNHPKRQHEDISVMKRTVRSYLRPYWLTFVLALGQLLFISALELLKPWPLKVIIDNVLSGNPLPWGFAASWSSESLLVWGCIG